MYGDPDNYFISHGDFGSKAERRRALIREIVQRTGTSDPTILDVGAGRGETLEAARLEGVTTAVGLEFSTAMIEYAGAHGLRVRQQTAEEFADTTADTFDAVVLAAVAEHVADPDSLLRAAARLTCTGGVLMIDVPRDPNIVTMLHRTWQRLRRSPGVLNLSPTFSPYHVYGFDPRSLRRLLTKHGYRIEHMLISAAPSVINNGTVKDRLMSMAGGALIRIGNRTGLAPNMTVWARRQ